MKLVSIFVFQFMFMFFKLSAQVISEPFTDTLKFTRISVNNGNQSLRIFEYIVINNKNYSCDNIFPMNYSSCYFASENDALEYFSLLDLVNEKRFKRFWKIFKTSVFKKANLSYRVEDMEIISCIKDLYRKYEGFEKLRFVISSTYLVSTYYIINCDRSGNDKIKWKCDNNGEGVFQNNQYILPVDYIKWWR